MDLKNLKRLLKKPIISNNEVLEFSFYFTNQTEGNIYAYDKQLEVKISAEWKLDSKHDETIIIISGFNVSSDIKLIYNIKDLEDNLKRITSAYDLVGE